MNNDSIFTAAAAINTKRFSFNFRSDARLIKVPITIEGTTRHSLSKLLLYGLHQHQTTWPKYTCLIHRSEAAYRQGFLYDYDIVWL